MKSDLKWQLGDAIDLEAMLKVEQPGEGKGLSDRDRQIYLEYIRPQLATDPKRQGTRRDKLRLWLEARRAALQGAVTPGEAFHQAYVSFLLLFAGFGTVVGASVAIGHLVYYGDRPINLAIFLAVTVMPQVALLIFFAVGLCFYKSLSSFRGLALLRWSLARALVWIAEKREDAFTTIGGEKRARLNSVWGVVKAKQRIYGHLFQWPLLILTQTFAVFFNVGVLAAILVSVSISNRAFGWETTLAVGPETMFRFVKLISGPWSLFPNPHPSLHQVIGSRIAIHGSGSYPIDALTSWWPFLCYAVLFYGLLPRALLLTFAACKQRRALASLLFDHAACNELLRRMQPLVVAENQPCARTEDAPTVNQIPLKSTGVCAALVPEELDLPRSALEALLQEGGWQLWERMTAEIDCSEANSELFQRLTSLNWAGARPKFAVFIEATRPPIRAIRRFIQDLRSTVQKNAEIKLFIVRSDPSNIDYFGVWKEFGNSLGDPYLMVARAN